MGIFIPRIRGNAAIVGFIGGFIIVLITKMHTDIHLMLYGFIGMVGTVIIGLLASMIIPEKSMPLEGLTVKDLNQEK